MGHPKALLEWKEQPLVLHHIQALEQRCQQVIVVLGANANTISSVLPERVHVVLNTQWKETELRDSLRIGLENVKGPAFVTPIDLPPAPAQVLDALIGSGTPSVPTYGQRTGHPVFIDAEQTSQQLHHERLDQILSSASKVAVNWPDAVLNLNTPEQWHTYLSLGPAPFI